jgi:hypothetical protein
MFAHRGGAVQPTARVNEMGVENVLSLFARLYTFTACVWHGYLRQ